MKLRPETNKRLRYTARNSSQTQKMGDCEQMEIYSGIFHWAADVSTQIRLLKKQNKTKADLEMRRKSSTTGRNVTVPVIVLLGNLGAEIHL